MTNELLRVLSRWPILSGGGADVAPVARPSGFSGANVWRVDVETHAFALRRWQPQITIDRLALIHVVQSVLAAFGPPVIPVLQKTKDGAAIASFDGSLWELASWRPGTADFRQRPSDARLTAAMYALAAIHNAAADHLSTPWPFGMESLRGRDSANAARRRSDSATRRACRLLEIVLEAGNRGYAGPLTHAPGDVQPLVRDAVALIKKLAPQELDKARAWQEIDLPLQYRLGDVHHDHVLFVGDEVTGIVDFGAVDFDAPAGDVARLLGSLVGDDRARWQQGLAAYREIRPLSHDEVAAAEFFDSSGTVIAAANWLAWLWPEQAEQALPLIRVAGVERLRQLLVRLRHLAERPA